MIDSHCHLADDAFAGDADAVIDRARAAGVHQALCILDAGHPTELERASALRHAWPSLRFAVGVHPHQAHAHAARLEQVARTVERALDGVEGACAVGEIGLDFHYDFSPRELQAVVLRTQVRLAAERGLPVVIHARLSEAEVLDVLEQAGRHRPRGVFHCFTGDRQTVERVLQAGFFVGVGGILTFTRAHDVRDTIRQVPLERVLIETDSPYLAPTPHRGKRNEPAWVARVAEALAELHGVSCETVVAQTSRNFAELFGERDR